MTEDAKATIKGLLCTLEGLKNSQDDAIYDGKSHFSLLKTLNTSLASCEDLPSMDAHRVLAMSVQYKLDMQYAPYVLSIISSLIKMNKTKTFTPAVEFLPSALAILDFLKQNCEEINLNNLRALSFQVLMSLPQAALVQLVKDHCPLLIETFALFLSTNSKCTLDTKVEALSILQLVRLLPAQERSMFVKEGIPLWLSGVLPTITQILLTIEDTEKIHTHLTHFELLASELVEHDYSEYPEWFTFLDNAGDPKKFHTSIQCLLENGKDWHRIWIVIIKLLKDCVTKSNGNGTPINAMLPAVETAFKMESIQRVRAFACWNELIRNFSSHTHTHNSRRLKLIVIPLRLNNVRTEDSAIAKFNTWWLFVRKFKSQLGYILIEFIHFLFGKERPSKSCVGQFFESLRKLCLEAFVELLGHSDCEESFRCTAIEPFGGKAVNTYILAQHWVDWLYALKCALKFAATNYNPKTRKNIRCIWKSFLLLMIDVTDESAKRVWFNDLIEMLSICAQNSVIYEDFFVMIIEDLTLPIFKDVRMQTLLNSSPDHRPMNKVLALITEKTFDSYFKKFLPEDLSKMLQPIVSNLLSESITHPEYTIQLLNDLPRTDSSLKLWTAFIRTASSSDLCPQLLSALLIWPFQMVQNSTDVKDAALAWFTVYNVVHEKLDKIEFSNEISKLLTKPVEDSRAANYFILFALIGVLKLKPDEDKMAKLEALTYEINDYEEFEPLIPPLVEALTFMMDNVASKKYENLAQITINCMNNLLKLLNSETQSNPSTNILISTNIPYIDKSVLFDAITISMKACLDKNPNETIKKEIENITSSLGQSIKDSCNKFHVVPKESASPKVVEVKKSRKKAASIVNTVVENGEEYVVVKSNWKFNPKNLTENQKEKFNRKRDIPALYQDLSQSQDEFKLSTWKTDSQDTSLSSSKSATNTDASEMLKIMPGTDVVPKIMENILDSTKTANQKMSVYVHKSPVSNVRILKTDEVVFTPKDTKSPRMAFKDKVFRNVRNLIEKSPPSTNIEIEKDVNSRDAVCKSPTRKLSNENTGKIGTLNQIENALKSPISKPMPIDNKDDKNTKSALPLQTEKSLAVHTLATKKKDGKITNSALPLHAEESLAVHIPAAKKKDDKIKNSALSLQSEERPAVHTPATKKKDGKITNSALPLQTEESPAVHTPVTKKKDGKITYSALPLQTKESSAVHTPATKKKVGKITNSALPLQTEERPAVHTPATKKKDYKITNSALPLQTEESLVVYTPAKKKKDDKITNSALPLQAVESLAVHTPARKKKVDKITNSAFPLQAEKSLTVHIPESKKKDVKITDLALPLQTEEIPAVDTPATKKKDDKITNSTLRLQTEESLAVHTPQSKKKDDIITNSAHALQSGERPARMKRKPKKYDCSLLPPLKKSLRSTSESQTDSQESSVQPEIAFAQIHTTKDMSYNTDIDQTGITALKENDVAKKTNANKPPTINNDVVKVLKDVGNKKSPINKKDILITPTTPITKKTTEKSPEKPTTTVEVPIDKDKASHGIENSVTQIVTEEGNKKEKSPTIQIALIKLKEADIKRTPVLGKRVLTIKLLEKNKNKTTTHTENSGGDGVTSLVSNLLDIPQDRNQEIPPANPSIIENRTDEEPDVVVPTINQINKDKYSQKSAKMQENNENSESLPTQPSASKELGQPKAAVANKEMHINNSKNESNILETQKNHVEYLAPKSSIKKTVRKSRIESELEIDMLEGHPFLKAQSEKRITRKKVMEVEKNSRRKSLADKLNKSSLEATPKSTKNLKKKNIFSNSKTITVEESQDKQTSSPVDYAMDEPPCSEDIIESSQDSTITTISVKSTKRTPIREPVVSLERLSCVNQLMQTQDLIKDSEITDLRIHNEETHEKTDIELSQNKTAEVDKNTTDLTENMDTEPIGDINASVDLIILDNTESSLIIKNSEPVIGLETQELAEADTQPNDPEFFIEIEGHETVHQNQLQTTTVSICKQDVEKEITDNDITQSLPEPPSLVNIDNTNEVSSPFKNDDLRKQDFLNNTLEISPIKIRSPEREKKSPSPETSSDFVVIKLSSPVHINGEPFEKYGSPEFFTEDKVSPDKRDVSPPRPEVAVTNTSPCSSLSLKKNRTAVRSGGRAAQMLDLICVNSDLKIMKVPEHAEPEDIKKATTSTPARRNLRILYNSVGENGDNSSDQNMDEEDNFLKLQRTLPTVSSSPSGPILKRKLIDIMDEATASPASKRKRVSFHDPPVSTSISVHKYIEPLSLIRSPQSSTKKRFERQTRSGIKSPKRLENAFNLDSVLSKTVESFIEAATPTDDTQNYSMDITPIVEIVKSSELNDTDPFYPDLIDCKDPIGIIATELSSSAMRDLFVKELEGKVETVGDLAKMTELEINRLCIKAPKIKVVKKVLTDYAAGRKTTNLIDTEVEEEFSELRYALTASVEMQTDQLEVSSKEMQTVSEPTIVACIQTEDVSMAHTSMQTDTADMTTEDTISLCLAKGGDFIEKLSEKLDDESIKTVAQRLPTNAIFDLLVKKSTSSTTLQNRLLKYLSKDLPEDKKHSAELSFVRDYLFERYERSNLFTMCIKLLEKINDKSA